MHVFVCVRFHCSFSHPKQKTKRKEGNQIVYIEVIVQFCAHFTLCFAYGFSCNRTVYQKTYLALLSLKQPHAMHPHFFYSSSSVFSFSFGFISHSSLRCFCCRCCCFGCVFILSQGVCFVCIKCATIYLAHFRKFIHFKMLYFAFFHITQRPGHIFPVSLSPSRSLLCVFLCGNLAICCLKPMQYKIL